MKSMYHDSAALPDGLTVHETATALAVQDLYALRAATAAMYADLAALDPFGAQTATASDASALVADACEEGAVVDVLSDGHVDFFRLGVAAVDWRGWGENAGPEAWDGVAVRWGVLADELRRLAASLESAGLSDAAEHVRRAAIHADDIADS